MCLITKKVKDVETSTINDAVLIQFKDGIDNPTSNYENAVGIIHHSKRADCSAGLSFNPLMTIGGVLMASAGYTGDVNDVVNFTKYQFGEGIDDYDYIPVSYTDPNFPSHLIPN